MILDDTSGAAVDLRSLANGGRDSRKTSSAGLLGGRSQAGDIPS